MYWPIGAPSIYEQDLRIPDGALSDDGLNQSTQQKSESLIPDLEKQNVSPSGSPPDDEGGTNGISTDDDGPQTQSQEDTNGFVGGTFKEKSPGVNAQRRDDSAIIGVKSSRTGHLFVTITRTTLSVWQTKVNFSL